MPGRPVARPERVPARYVRGFGAAVVAVAALVTAGHASPAHAADRAAPAPYTSQDR
ncbi:hypothetical protein ABZ920_28555 [Streptomyces sp. NPDC046831]|uniref:hypothetical protein n=1 Tax=Streptomyces sp. NPDC046831 TaxID=3154805 RepID=UPI0033C6EDA4